MIKFPNCKINIGLNILSKREDGYHNLQTIFYPIPVTDALEVIESKNPSQQISFSQTGIKIPVTGTDNICVSAYELLKKDFPKLPSIQMHLHKAIPIGAGIGGGSADGAFSLMLLNEKFALGLSESQLVKYASELGSDCAFFIHNKPCLATGRGEILEPLEIDLSSYQIVLVNPGIHVSTAAAFNKIEPGRNRTDLLSLVQQPIETWKNNVVNDFEGSVFNSFPEIASVKENLYQQGALYASMSGSGSTVYGIFDKSHQPGLNYPSHYFFRWI